LTLYNIVEYRAFLFNVLANIHSDQKNWRSKNRTEDKNN